jgi:hypothetical protein
MTDTTTPLPPVVDRDTWTGQVDELRVRETAHTREGDAIAATQRRLPMVEVDASTPLRRWQSQLLLIANVFHTVHEPRVCNSGYHSVHQGESVEFDPIANDTGPITTIEITKSRSTARRR